MELSNKKKLDIFIETHALGRLEKMLGEAGFKGWSVLTCVQGSGVHGVWQQTGVVEADSRLVIAVGTDAACEAALAWLGDYFKSYPGVVAVTDVGVMRGERF